MKVRPIGSVPVFFKLIQVRDGINTSPPAWTVALLIAQPNVSRSSLEQQYFILAQVPVLLYGRSRRKLLRTQHKMLRAIVFRTNLQHELGSGHGLVVRSNTANPQFAFILFQEQRLGAGFWT